MNPSFSFDGVGLWQTAGWTMLHFLWLGTLLGLAALAGRWLLRRAAPNVRYVAALGVLALLAALPVGIAAWLVQNPPLALPVVSAVPDQHMLEKLPLASQPSNEIIELHAPQPLETALTTPGPAGGFPPAPDASQGGTGPGDPRTTKRGDLAGATGSASVSPELIGSTGKASGTLLSTGTFIAMLDTAVPYLPWVWLVGTPLTFLLIATGLIGSERLRRASRVIEDGRIAETVARLLQTMRIGRRVTVAVCERIAAPVLVGILRPIILLPPAALTGWSPDEIEMVLLHELAHVRRWDNLVNLAQRLIESLLFFHPAVWLVSNWVRREREACCDAVVVARTNRPHAYAEMLVALAAQMPRSVLFHPAASSAMAAGPLRGRIRRILQLEEDPMLVSGKSFVLVLGSFVVAATLAVLYLPTLGQAEESVAEKANSEKLITEGTESVEQKNLQTARSALSNEDDRNFQELFNINSTNPVETRVYEVLPTLRDSLPSVFEGLQKDPYGPQLQFEANWEERGQKVRVRAPKLAHDGFFSKVAVEVGVSQLQSLAGSALGKDSEESGNVKSTSEEWPDGVVFPSPKEGEISRRAWKELGLKVAPASEVELEQVRKLGFRGGLKLVDFEYFPHMEGPFILTEIQSKALGTGIARFSDLERALDAFKSQKSDELIILTGAAKNGKFTYSLRRPEAATAASEKSQSRFPSLEDQKLADLAWKRLGLELEPISGDDLKRVQALGFEGGVKVIATGNNPIVESDILVGLHVWPTTSLKQVAEVLSRDDLNELNPLKFYVVRQEETGGTNDNPTFSDMVHTGRISVKLDRPPQPKPAPSAGQPTGATPTPAPAQDRYGSANPYNGPTYSSAPTQVVPTWPTTPPQAGGGWNQPRVAAVDPQPAALEPTRSLLVEPSRQPTYERPVPGPAEEEDVLIPSTLAPTRAPLPSPTPTMIAQVPRPAGAANNKANLRYNDQTFAEWSDAWRTELSTEKRLEAVKALAAFGRAGYGKEAAEAILDVAGEYDFDFSEDDVDGKLKETVLDELAPNYRRHLLAEYWVPDLAKRLEKEPKKWTWQAALLLERLKTDDPDVIAILQSLAQNGPGQVRNAALWALVRSGQSRDGATLRVDDKTRELLAAALKSEDQDAVRFGLRLLLYYPPNAGSSAEPQLVFLPELVPLLFQADEGIRKQARGTLQPIEEKDAPPVVQQLVAVLADQTRSGDHIEAIRALAVMGPKAESAVPNLRKILASSDADNPLRYAAAVALENIDKANFQKVWLEVLGKELEIEFNEGKITSFGGATKYNRFQAGLAAERNQLYPPPHPGQGGGGFGGGGGGGFF